MSGEIAYKLTADEAQALQAVSRLSREFGLNETAIKKAADAAKELDRTQQQMGREAQRIFDETRTEAERYAEQLAHLGELHKANAIDADTYGRAVKQVQQQHESAFGADALSKLESFAEGFNPATKAAELLLKTLENINEARERGAQADRTAEQAMAHLAQVADDTRPGYSYLELTGRAREISEKQGMTQTEAADFVFAGASGDAVDQMDVFAQLKGQGIIKDPAKLLRAARTLQEDLGQQQSGSLRDITSALLAAGHGSPVDISDLAEASANAAIGAPSAGVSFSELLAGMAVESTAKGSDVGAAGTMMSSLEASLARVRSGQPAASVNLEAEEKKIRDQAAAKNEHHIGEVLAHLRKQPGWAGRGEALDKKENEIRAELTANMQAGIERQILQLETKATRGGIETDEEGHPLDASAKKVRAALNQALQGKTGLMEQLHAIEALKLDEAQLFSGFGRKEAVRAYHVLLAHEDQFARLHKQVEAAPGRDEAGRVLALPGTDKRVAAATLARIGAAQQEEAEAGQYSTEANAISGVLASSHAKALKEGHTITSAIESTLENTVGRIPGVKRGYAIDALRVGETDLDNQHLVSAVESLGGREKVFKGFENYGGMAQFDRAVRQLADAAQHLKDVQGKNRPTLAPPNSKN